MIDHTGIGVADVESSARFYDAALAALGMRRVHEMKNGTTLEGVGYGYDFPIFWIDRFHPHSQKNHTAFRARSRAEVDAFHAAGIKHGGRDNGAPGDRTGQSTKVYYAAFLHDSDGNNLEAVFRGQRGLPRLTRADPALMFSCRMMA
jgi:catechol 2,3-dioxygenase-like lactoylglutathione lyase family enzyme